MPTLHDLVDVAFEVPKRVTEGLAAGRFIRRGGVIQVAGGPEQGQVVMWLRETKALQEALLRTPPQHLPLLGAQVSALQTSVHAMLGIQFVSLAIAVAGFQMLKRQIEAVSKKIDMVLSTTSLEL